MLRFWFLVMLVCSGGCGVELHYNGAPIPDANTDSEVFRIEFETLERMGLTNGLELGDLKFVSQPWEDLYQTCAAWGDCLAITNGRGHIWIADTEIPDDHCDWYVIPKGYDKAHFYPGAIMHEMLHNVGYEDGSELESLELQAVRVFKSSCN